MKDNFAIQGFEYTIYDEEAMTKNWENKSLLFKTKLEYMQKGGSMYLSYHSMDNAFRVAKAPKLKFENVVLNLDKNLIVLKFTNTLKANAALKKSNYIARFKGKKINIKKLVLIGDEVHVNPELDNKRNFSLFQELKTLGEKQKVNNENLKVYLRGLIDIDGNIINEYTYEDKKQFRKFFVQELKPITSVLPKDSLYMDKKRPIFEDQPISVSGNLKEYWMNTPLKTSNQ